MARRGYSFDNLLKNSKIFEVVVYSFLFLISLVGLPLIVQIQWRAPAVLFAAAAAGYLIFSAYEFINARIVLVSAPQTTEAFYRDTYYVITRGYSFLSLGAIMVFMALITWVQSYFGMLRYTKTTQIMFWLLHLGLLAASVMPMLLFHQHAFPQRYIDYPEQFRMLITFTSWATQIYTLAAIGLFILLVVSTVQALLANKM